MGIYDRDYYREHRPSHPRPGRSRSAAVEAMRIWSVNTWLIIICVAVHLIDSRLPDRYVESGRLVTVKNVQFDPKQLVVDRSNVERIIDPETRQSIFGFRLLAYSGGPQIGWAEALLMHPIQGLLYFSTHKILYGFEWWRFIGFQFLHASWMHVFLNMLGLYFFGPMVEQYLGGKRYLAFYLLCGIFGALMYLLLNLGGYIASEVIGTSVRIPGLLFNNVGTPLIGASAGVFGVIMAGAYLAPDAVVYVFFLLPARLATVAYLLVGAALLAVLTSGNNAGGEAAHLGGAIGGYYFIRHPRHLHGFFDILGRADPTSHHYRRSRAAARQGGDSQDRREIDRILDKISRSSIHSLSDEEKRILREASER